MEKKKYHFIYKTTCKVTGFYYYGMHITNNLEDNYLGSGRRLRSSIRKYGKENHSIYRLEFFKNREELSKREKEIVNENEIAKKECLNMILGGEAFSSGNIHMKVSSMGGLASAKKYRENPELEKRRKERSSQLFKKLHRENKLEIPDWTGRKHSEKTRIKMKESQKGKHLGKLNSQFGTKWIHNDIKTIKISATDEIPIGWKPGRLKT